MKSKDTAVAALILNWNGYDQTKECLQSLANQTHKPDIYVIDNNSSDGSGERIAKEFPDVQVLFNSSNDGFGGGINFAAQTINLNEYEYLWILNNDVLFSESNCLSELLGTMDDNPEIGILSPKILKYPEIDEIWFEQAYVDWEIGDVGHRKEPMKDPNGTVYNDYIPLCCALVRTEAFRNVNGLAEEYFLYYEDVDFGVKVKRAGYSLVTDCRATVYHRVSQSSTSSTQSYYNTRNRIIFARNFWENISTTQFIFALAWSFLYTLAYHIKNLQYEEGKKMCMGYFDGVLGRSGKLKKYRDR